MAGEVLSYVIERSIVFGIVFLVAGAIWLVVRRWMSSHVGSAWFLLPLVVLVVPVEAWIPNPWSAGNPLGAVARAVSPDQVERVFADARTDGFLDPTLWNGGQAAVAGSTVAEATPMSADGSAESVWALSAGSWLVLAWALGFAVFLVRLARGQRLVPEMLTSARPLEPLTDALPVDMELLQLEAGVEGRLLIFESADFESPAVWTGSVPAHAGMAQGSGDPDRSGASRAAAAIILPEGLGARLSPAELRWVLLHELAHLARRDTQVELLQRVIGAAFFFHPLVWATNRIARGYREMACDDAALARCAKSERARCARALFEVVAHASALSSKPSAALRRYRTTHAMASLFNSKQLTRKRIMRLIEIDRPLRRGLRISALLPLFLVSGVALAAARFPSAQVEGPSESTQDRLEKLGYAGGEDHNEADVTDKEIREAVKSATDWLMASQGDNGGWQFDPDHLKTPETKPESGKPRNLTGKRLTKTTTDKFESYHSEVAMTGLALQALVRQAKFDPSNKKLQSAIENGLEYLVSFQDVETGIYGWSSWTTMVGQSLATEAIARASLAGFGNNQVLTTSLRESVGFFTRSRNPYGAWRYDFPPRGDNDARVTGYVLLALTAAAEAGVQAGEDEFYGGMMFMLEMENQTNGRTEYMQGNTHALRLAGRAEAFPAERAETPTAMHMRLRNAPGMEEVERGEMVMAEKLLHTQHPRWSTKEGTIDFTYWWQGAEALASAPKRGGAWAEWRYELAEILVSQQRPSGPMGGTWATVDAWSAPGSEVYTTATCALSLLTLLENE